MTNDSSTGGYILPLAAPAPLDDQALDRFLQSLVTNITGLAGTLVFPRWQATEPNLPGITVNWASIGLTDFDAGFPFEQHDPILTPAYLAANPNLVIPPNGYDIQITQERIVMATSFYGPQARSNARLFRDGLQMVQNKEALVANGFNFGQHRRMVTLPELVNNQWYFRVDLETVVNREVVRFWPIQDLLSAEITIVTDTTPGIDVTINIQQE